MSIKVFSGSSASSGTAPVTPSGSTVYALISGGQSNSIYGVFGGITGPTYPTHPRLYMWTGSQSNYHNVWNGQYSELAQPPNIKPFDPGTIVGLSNLLGNSYGTCPVEGAGCRYATLHTDRDVVVFSTGQVGADIDSLAEGGTTGCFEKTIAVVTRGLALAAAEGLALNVAAIMWNQGEANYSTTNLGTLLQDEIYTPLNTQIKALTGQANDIILVAVQPSSFSDSSAGVRSLLDKALEDGNIVMAGPTYWQEWAEAHWLHHSNTSQFQMGELQALVLERKLTTGHSLPLYMTGATMAAGATTITATWNRDIEIDTVNVPTDARTYYGLQARTGSDGSAVLREITDVQISGATMTITIASAFAGVDPQILIGMVGQSEAGSDVPIPRTNIRAVTPLGTSELSGGKTLYEWACHQQVFVSVT